MPVTAGSNVIEMSQRLQYQKGGLGRKYWDYRDSQSFRHLKGPAILDAGCGEGITLEKLIKLHPDWNIEGLDIDTANVSICKSIGLPAQHGSLYELPFENERFDSCLFMEVIEHLEHPDKALGELARVTKKNGRLVIVFPIDWAMYAVRLICLRFKEAAFDPGHLRQWSIRDLAIALRSYGFGYITAISLPLPTPFALHKLVVAQKS